jgi:oligopeptide transport system permease protein
MLPFIFRRLLQAIPVLLAIHFATFFLVRSAPGDPFSDEEALPPEVLQELNAYYGLDKPMLVQYGLNLKNLLQGDLGPSFKYPGRSVNELIAEGFPVSLELALWAIAIALCLGIPVGILAAMRKNSLFDYIPMSFAMVGICLPTFVLGPLFLLIFSISLGWFNPLGWGYASDRILPSATLGLFYAAYVARLTRGGMLEVLTQDYILTARAKGLKEFSVVMRHALIGGIQPVITFLGPAFAGVITGSFIIETIFFVPGMGRYFINGAFNRDYSVVMGAVLVYALLIVMLNLTVDLIQAWLNPRMRSKL